MQDALILRFIDERGVDSGGVSRDVYSAFWIELFEGSAQGCNQRVPCIRNDMGWKDWEAVGRVLAKGFVDHGFFPVHLCKAFVMACLDGPDSVSEDILVTSFMDYISDDDRDCLKKALSNMEEMDDEEYDELLDVLSRYRCRTVPSKGTVLKVVATVAHKELIQKPKYIIDACSQSFHFIRAKGITSATDLHSLYDKLTPTAKKFIKLVKASPTAQSQTDALEYFKQYIRCVEQTTLEKLVRFCTGSTVLCFDKLEIQFTKCDGFSRQPVALTCGPTLQLEWTHTNIIY
ncbi:hypothetical protein HOLleu_00181 [Holothuria leucospilota]|uniref:HECT domain-containing protein n=1 Tax=Holothuria leucospilota TaxID=206669 RepID=A0A9Q1CN82_HOLLE|nr:hypothetical protein HOLleu_00181 [Holothuria leucospilota]